MSESVEADATKDMMLSMIYHDLASPIQVIRACTDMVEMELKQKSRPSLELIRDMVETSKRNERRLFEMVETVCADFRLLLRENISFEWDVPSITSEIVITPNLMNRKLFNLLDNTARYSRPGGNILVSAHYDPGNTRVIFRIFDDGEAIPPEFQSCLFQKNLVMDPKNRMMSMRRDHGFGLYFCRLTVERFGGSIWAESREGWGTQFSFTLPIAPLSADGGAK